MTRALRPVTRTIAAVMIGVAAVAGGGAAVAHAATHLDYSMVMDHSDHVLLYMTDNSGTLTGTAIDRSGSNCKGTVTGTLSGTTANFQVQYNTIGGCGGALITYTGTLTPTRGHGTYTTSFGTSGTWVAGDRV